jgi:hypothetical protein
MEIGRNSSVGVCGGRRGLICLSWTKGGWVTWLIKRKSALSYSSVHIISLRIHMSTCAMAKCKFAPVLT